MDRRFKALVLLLTIAFSHAAVVMPGAIMRTLPSAGGSCDTIKDSQTTVDSFTASFLRYYASVFRAGSTYDLCRVDVSIARALAEDADFLITIRDDNAGEPDAAVLGTSATVPNATVTDDFTMVSFTFASPVTLTSGNDYWIVITRADNADGLQLYWEQDFDGGAVEGMMEAAAATPTTWSEITALAVGVFATYSQ